MCCSVKHLPSVALCRYNGRKILWLLMSHQEFDRMLTKYLPANTLRNIQDVVESLKSKVSHL